MRRVTPDFMLRNMTLLDFDGASLGGARDRFVLFVREVVFGGAFSSTFETAEDTVGICIVCCTRMSSAASSSSDDDDIDSEEKISTSSSLRGCLAAVCDKWEDEDRARLLSSEISWLLALLCD
jgi:hypothetical protein